MRLILRRSLECAVRTLRDHSPDSPFLTELEAADTKSYPQHPFSPEICDSISVLPNGFIELSMSGHLSFEMLNLLTRTVAMQSRLTTHRKELTVVLWNLIFDVRGHAQGKTTTDLEKYLCYGCWGFGVQLDAELHDAPILTAGTSYPIRSFLRLRRSVSPVPKACIVWACMSFAGVAMFHSQAHADLIIDWVLRELPESRDWDFVERQVCEFFWTHKMILKWRRCWERGIARQTAQMLTSQEQTTKLVGPPSEELTEFYVSTNGIIIHGKHNHDVG